MSSSSFKPRVVVAGKLTGRADVGDTPSLALSVILKRF